MGNCISSPRQNSAKVNMPRKSVDIPNDTWLEALKFLPCPQWSQIRYVCRQINGIVERNISCLPKMVIACAEMYYNFEHRAKQLENQRPNKNVVIAFHTLIQKKKIAKWFAKRGFTLKAPVDIPADNLLMGADEWSDTPESNLTICIRGSAQEQLPYSDEEKRLPSLREPVLFYAQFNPVSNRYSWNYLAQFLKFIYDPTSYVKEVKMFGVNQKFIDSIECNIGSIDHEPHYIRCESFSLKGLELSCATVSSNVSSAKITFLTKRRLEFGENLPNLLKWLTRNVRAEILTIPFEFDSLSLSNCLLDPSVAKECASNKVKIDLLYHNPWKFLSILIEQFRASPLVEGDVPTIEFSYPCRKLEELRANLIDQEVESLDAEAVYIVSNGQNRMRISLCKSSRSDRYDCEIKIDS